MKESELKSEVIRLLKLKGIFCWNNRNVGVYNPKTGKYIPSPVRGVPDIIGVLPNGRMIAIEVKTRRGQLTVYQKEFLMQLEHNNALVGVVRSIEDVVKLLEQAGL